ncbi:MAG: serine hydrolase [Algibacter sp.]|uniref:serine hydrolase domain-containing protein n=1 Tax=Algibacter sp. TaxID=1872428 RepID=UPI00262612E8|nr:serine hydrolase domain-containing protein [Algibacter sp.]MDG1728289.1 serine hydrolase [Algibacter sp.]MDG2178247.1 serine hydrolase [Algibacter sp.]
MNFQYKISLFVCFILVGLTSCKAKKQNGKVVSNDIIFQKILDSIYHQNEDCVGLMAHIEAPDKDISWNGAVGFSNKQTKSVLEKDQPVLIASNTKTYVAVAILRLVEQDKIELDSNIENYISPKSKRLLESHGYQLKDISVKHLLTHTSGIFDYAGSGDFFEFIKTQPNYRWTRDEQIQLAMSSGKPLGAPGDVFSYSDTNYLLSSEIIETLTGQDFYTAIRELLNFEGLNLDATWFSTLEEYPKNIKPLAYQYSTEEGVHSYSLDHSFDLFGGGGLAATTKDLAIFLYSVFNNKVFEKPNTLELLFTEVDTKQPKEWSYFLGISPVDFNDIKGFGHNGYWGTVVNHYPELNATISVFVLERDKRHLRVNVSRAYLEALKHLE